MQQAGITPGDYADTEYIISRESGWRVNATNGEGTYGLPQALPGIKIASAGSDWQTNPVTQLRWFKGYCEASYGSIHNAYLFWLGHRAY